MPDAVPHFPPERLSSGFSVTGPDGPRELNVYTEEGFWALADLFARASQENTSYGKATWMGRPILGLAEDVLLLADLLWRVRPGVVLELGVGLGGTTLLAASVLEATGQGRVIGIDGELRSGVADALREHPLGGRIELLQTSLTDPSTLRQLRSRIGTEPRVLAILNAGHSHDHALAQLEACAPLVSPGFYLVVFGGEEQHGPPRGSAPWRADRPVGPVGEFLSRHPEFEADARYQRLGATLAPSGWLLRTS